MQLFEGFALGTTLLLQNRNRHVYAFALYAFGFSIMGPIGVAIGMALDTSTSTEASDWVQAIGDALAAGVFVFVAISHLLVKAMRVQPGDRWWTPLTRWAMCALGVLTVSLLQLRSS